MDKTKVFLSRYTPRLVPAEILERIFVQREGLARELVERIRQSALTEAKHHTLLAGPRGIGKSHLISLVYYRIRKLQELQEGLLIGWLAEEEWSITSFLDFLLCVLRALEEESRKTGQPSPDISGIESFYEQPADAVPKAAQLLREFIGNRTLLLLVENFDELLGGLGKEEQKQLRGFLDENSCMVLATAQSVFRSAKKGRSPFFDFFQQEQLEELDVDDARELLAKIANYKGNRELESFIKNGKGRDRLSAVHHLAGGNHRLYIIFSEFLIHRESLDELVEVFMRTLDDLTPYYQDRMRSISPQQRKILNFLCQEGKAVPVKDIAGRCLISHQTASSQLKKLLDLCYVRSETSGRVSYYEVREPMMRFCLEVKRLRGEPISLLVDFLRLWYGPFELQERLKQLPADAALERKYLESALELAQKDAKYFGDIKFSKKIGDNYARPGDAVSIRQVAEEKLSTVANEQDWFEQGSSLLKQKRWEEALASFEQAIVLNYNDEEVWYGRGLALQELNRDEEALASFKRAIELNSNNEEAWLQRGAMEVQREYYEEALSSFNQVIQLNCSNHLAWIYRGIILWYELEDNTETLESFDKAIELDSNNNLAWFFRGEVLNELERYEEALVSFSKAIELSPNDKEAWLNQAKVLIRLQRYEEALVSLNKAIELDPNNESAWFGLGLMLAQLERYEEALVSFEHLIKLNPNDREAWFHRASALGSLQRCEEALESFNKTIELNPNNDSAWYFQGLVLRQLERNEEALASFNKAIELNPNNESLWLSRGVLLFQLQRYQKALASFNKTIELNPNNELTWWYQGEMLSRLERYEEALASFDRAIELNSNNESTWWGQGVMLFQLERCEEALASFEQAIKLNPNNKSTWLGRGLLLRQLQRHEEALTSLDKAIELDRRSPEAFFYRAETLLALNRWEEGMTALEEALDRFTQTTESCDTEAVIRHLLNSTNDAATWKTRIANLVKIYDKYKLAASVGQGIVRCIPALMSEMISDTAARKWLELWQEITSDRRDFQVPLRLLAVAVRYKETKGDRRVLLELPIEERKLLQPLVEIGKNKK